jgi:protein gp37
MGEIDGSIIALFDWAIIGGKTGHEPFTPPMDWVDPIVEWGRYMKRPLFIKSNCQYPEKIKQYPEVENNGNSKEHIANG